MGQAEVATLGKLKSLFGVAVYEQAARSISSGDPQVLASRTPVGVETEL